MRVTSAKGNLAFKKKHFTETVHIKPKHKVGKVSCCIKATDVLCEQGFLIVPFLCDTVRTPSTTDSKLYIFEMDLCCHNTVVGR